MKQRMNMSNTSVKLKSSDEARFLQLLEDKKALK